MTERMIELRPRFEGANIGTWLGFKHINYLVEEAVLRHLQDRGYPVSYLFRRHAVGLDFTVMDTRIRGAVHLDDRVVASVSPVERQPGEYRVKLVSHRPDGETHTASSRVQVVLRRDGSRTPAGHLPDELAELVVESIGQPVSVSPRPVQKPRSDGPTIDTGSLGSHPFVLPVDLEQATQGNSYVWVTRIPYFYCHWTERLQMSGLLRYLEEIVDRFLAARGSSIMSQLDRDGWIPACTHTRVEMLNEARMEEELILVFRVTDCFKRLTYTADFDTFVVRDGQTIHISTGSATHGYARLTGPSQWGLVSFDDQIAEALAP